MKRVMSAMFCLAVAAPVMAQQKPPQTFPQHLQGQYATLKRNIMGSAEKMPAEHFSFRPSPDVRTYAELFGHTIETQYFFCSTANGAPDPAVGKKLEQTVTDKAGVIQMVKDAFDYCDDVFTKLTNDNVLEIVTAGTPARQYTRANQLSMVIVHGNEHYGNLVTYMRIKGIVPPSSAPR